MQLSGEILAWNMQGPTLVSKTMKKSKVFIALPLKMPLNPVSFCLSRFEKPRRLGEMDFSPCSSSLLFVDQRHTVEVWVGQFKVSELNFSCEACFRT